VQEDIEEELEPHERKKLKKIKAMVDSEDEEEDGEKCYFLLLLGSWFWYLGLPGDPLSWFLCAKQDPVAN
jgi:hypothetical protein